MHSHHLTIKQLAVLRQSIERELAFFHRLRDRMIAKGFPNDDMVWRYNQKAIWHVDNLRDHLRKMQADAEAREDSKRRAKIDQEINSPPY